VVVTKTLVPKPEAPSLDKEARRKERRTWVRGVGWVKNDVGGSAAAATKTEAAVPETEVPSLDKEARRMARRTSVRKNDVGGSAAAVTKTEVPSLGEEVVSDGEGRKKTGRRSKFVGVRWHKAAGTWAAYLTPAQTGIRACSPFVAPPPVPVASICLRQTTTACLVTHGAGRKSESANTHLPPPLGVVAERGCTPPARGVHPREHLTSYRCKLTAPLFFFFAPLADSLYLSLSHAHGAGRSDTRLVGFFKEEEAAARAHDRAALACVGEEARTNYTGYDLRAIHSDLHGETRLVRGTASLPYECDYEEGVPAQWEGSASPEP
jgi:hypothetical protein